ncbi:MAG: STAS domain-containing protein [Candidatus Baltobacteraceae bacterium]
MDDAAIVRLTGEYDISRRDELDSLLDRFGDAEPLVFDFEAVNGIDTAAMRSLVRFQRARTEAGKTPIVLAHVSARVRDFLAVADLGETFELRDDI